MQAGILKSIRLHLSHALQDLYVTVVTKFIGKAVGGLLLPVKLLEQQKGQSLHCFQMSRAKILPALLGPAIVW